MSTPFRRLAVTLTIVFGLTAGLVAVGVAEAPPAQAHNVCESFQHPEDNPNFPHATDFECETPVDFSCGDTMEVRIEARFTGFGVFDSSGAVQLWAVNYSSGGYNTVTKKWGDSMDVDNKWFRLQTNWHKVRRVSMDGSYFNSGYFGSSTFHISCANNTRGWHYVEYGNL